MSDKFGKYTKTPSVLNVELKDLLKFNEYDEEKKKEITEEALNYLVAAKIYLQNKIPWMGAAVMELSLSPIMEGTPNKCTVGVTQSEMVFYPPFVLELVGKDDGKGNPLLPSVLLHEALHVLLLHPLRGVEFSPEVWNLAADHVVHDIMMSMGYSNLGFHLQELKDNTAEEVYYKILDAADKIVISAGGVGGAIGGDIIPQDKGSGDTKDHSDAANKQRMKWRAIAADAVEQARARGIHPSGIARDVGLEQKEPSWIEKISSIVATITQWGVEFRDWTIPHSRFLVCDLYYPRFRKKTFNLVIAIDTSASISDKELRTFVSEIYGALNIVSSCRTAVIFCDADVHSVIMDPDPNEMIVPEGGGGTSFVPVFKKVEELRIQEDFHPHLMVYYTDTYGDFPNEPPDYPVVWCVVGEKAKVPWGEVVRVKLK